jgi:hypothetical protein
LGVGSKKGRDSSTAWGSGNGVLRGVSGFYKPIPKEAWDPMFRDSLKKGPSQEMHAEGVLWYLDYGIGWDHLASLYSR